MDWTFFSEPFVQLILATAGLVILVLVGIYILGKLRHEVRQRGEPMVDYLAEFRDLRDRGIITDKEYEKIRANLTAQSRRRQPSTEPKADSLPSDFTRHVDR